MTKPASRHLLAAAVACAVAAPAALAANQTATVTPIELDSSTLPYQIGVSEVGFAGDLPTLHSFAAGVHDGMWVLIAGRTAGLHGFMGGAGAINNFPPEEQNRDVWVIDLASGQSWNRSLVGQFSDDTLNSLTPTNNQFYQAGSTLYMTGGYGVDGVNPATQQPTYGTFDTLSAIDLPGIIDWVKTGSGAATSHVRQITDPIFTVTGGAMYAIGDKMHLVFGQDFDGLYTPNSNGTYTHQVRTFQIIDDGVNLSIANDYASTPLDAFRRRDLNVFPIITPDTGNGLGRALVALSGVFTPTFGAWTVPVVIDADGNPTMADPDHPDTFKQGFNGYHSAKLGLFSETTGQMHEILFGGISLQTYDPDTDTVITDNALPFINDITAVTLDADGNFRQTWLGEFPEILDLDGKRLRFGSNAEFFLAEGIETYDNGVIKLDGLTGTVTLGYIYGGLIANGPHTRNVPDVDSFASNRLFAVTLTIPEPGTLALFAATPLLLRRRR